MYKKKVLLLLTTIVSVFSLGFVFLTNANNMDFSNFASATSESYSISMSSTKNKLFSETGSTPYSGEKTIKTNLGNDIDFSYSNVMGLNNTWHVLKNGGCFYNKTPIHGLSSLTINFKNDDKNFKLYWSFDGTFNNENIYLGTSSSSDAFVFDFNGEYPYYVKFENSSGVNLNVASVDLCFSCQENVYQITASSDDLTKGSVDGAGSYKYGEEVNLVALPESGYSLLGWYENDSLVSNDNPFTFNMDNHYHNYVAKFDIGYNLFVSSENAAAGQTVAPSISCAGLTVTVKAIESRGWEFAFWYDEDLNEVSSNIEYNFVMPNHEVTLFAAFTEGYDVNVFTKVPSELSLFGSGHYLVDQSITVNATKTNNRGTFIGWFDNNQLMSNELSYTFTLEKPTTLEAKWHNLSISNNIVNGIYSSVNHIYVPDGITGIQHSVFSSYSFASIDLPNSLLSIGANAFSNNTLLQEIVLPNNVTLIEYQAFMYCTNLESITIPSSLSSLTHGLLRGCTSLSTIKYLGTMAQWESLPKAEYWNLSVPATSVICIDGSVSL